MSSLNVRLLFSRRSADIDLLELQLTLVFDPDAVLWKQSRALIANISTSEQKRTLQQSHRVRVRVAQIDHRPVPDRLPANWAAHVLVCASHLESLQAHSLFLKLRFGVNQLPEPRRVCASLVVQHLCDLLPAVRGLPNGGYSSFSVCGNVDQGQTQ